MSLLRGDHPEVQPVKKLPRGSVEKLLSNLFFRSVPILKVPDNDQLLMLLSLEFTVGVNDHLRENSARSSLKKRAIW